MSVVKRVTLVVGARPNFMKAAPLMRALQGDAWVPLRLVHTGQHFDESMSRVFFDQLHLSAPDAYLNIHGGSPAGQVAQIVSSLAEEFSQYPPSIVVVFGDVNSTLAAAVAANKMDLRLAHVEAGLRSFDRSMPEEHNRVVTDMLSDFLFTPSPDADENLTNEGIPLNRIFRVGNIMVDSLLAFRAAAEDLAIYADLGVRKQNYALVTLHRPSNVDSPGALKNILETLAEIGRELPVVFPVHPRTRQRIAGFGLEPDASGGEIKFVEPVSYLEFLNLMMNAKLVLTDSGGIQEETTILGIRCLTLRENTERPITISQGTNRLVGNAPQRIKEEVQKVLGEDLPRPAAIELWDGKTAERIVNILRQELG